MKKLVYYCDMDGVLADFNNVPNALNRFRVEPDFFKTLEPIWENLKAIKKMIQDGEIVNILSASPTDAADKAKREWLATYLPEVKKSNILIVRNGESKIAKIPSKIRPYAVLFDDFGGNLREWKNGGGRTAIKVLNGNRRKENRSYLQIEHIGEWANI